ncbi:MBL fold metallo-hydrolase [Kineococcus arenarius]|uniref:MBL fold metallo-hydrolase n=1 Tax=unclassified Kineococcus TaxID=2621656 RepID=UPI003D7EC3F5
MSGGARLRWLGHSTAVLDAVGVRVVTDPVLRPGLAHLRRRPPLPDPEHSADPALVLVSHLHHDHLDLPSLRRLRPRWVVAPPGAAAWLQHRLRGTGSAVVEAAAGRRLDLPGPSGTIAVTALPAHHDGGRTLGRVTGAPVDSLAVGHLVRLPRVFPDRERADGGPDLLLWALGDTGPFDGLAAAVLAAAGRRPDVALVPVGGWWRTLGPHHLDPEEAAAEVNAVGPAVAVPVHWGTLAPLGLARAMGDRWTAPGRRFARAVAAGGASRAVLLAPAGALDLDGAGLLRVPAAR